MILFNFADYGYLAAQLQSLSRLQPGSFTIARFSNGEMYARLNRQPVCDEHCVIMGTIAPPDEQALELMLLAHTLKKEGAVTVTAMLPYLAYSRQDKQKKGESLAAAWVGSLLKSSGVDQVITVDVHSERDKDLFAVPLVSLSSAEVFAKALTANGLLDATIVAPDNGAIGRCEAVKRETGIIGKETPYFEKVRTEKGVSLHGPIGKVGPRAVMIDDMLDTGGTLVSACKLLQEAGTREVHIFVTHGLFTGSAWTALWSLGVKQICCTDTIPFRAGIHDSRVEILSIVPQLVKEVAGWPALKRSVGS
jgi:ribose-phosphate pyrophosphokinase